MMSSAIPSFFKGPCSYIGATLIIWDDTCPLKSADKQLEFHLLTFIPFCHIGMGVGTSLEEQLVILPNKVTKVVFCFVF